jgi:hypothetical protein
VANLDVGGDTSNPVTSALVPSEHVSEGCGGKETIATFGRFFIGFGFLLVHF